MNMRGVEFSASISASEAKREVSRYMNREEGPPPVVFDIQSQIQPEEMRDLIGRMFRMFRAIFCTDMCGVEAKHRSTAFVMNFLSLMENLDCRMNPKRTKVIWIAKFNFLGLLRVCDSFVHYRHVRNLYEGGTIGEGMVKQLRPLVAKGVHSKWATNLLLSFYRHSVLNSLIHSLEKITGEGSTVNCCPLGSQIVHSKFKRFTTAANVSHLLEEGSPIPVLVYGTYALWKPGVVIVSGSRWYLRVILFDKDDCVNDIHGLTFFRVKLSKNEECYEEGVHPSSNGNNLLGYGLMLPNVICNRGEYRYSLMLNGWEYVNEKFGWSKV
jgi:hypothetical protein